MKNKILKLLSKKGPMTVKELEGKTKGKLDTVKQALKRLQREGKIEKAINPDHPRRPLYQLAKRTVGRTAEKAAEKAVGRTVGRTFVPGTGGTSRLNIYISYILKLLDKYRTFLFKKYDAKIAAVFIRAFEAFVHDEEIRKELLTEIEAQEKNPLRPREEIPAPEVEAAVKKLFDDKIKTLAPKASKESEAKAKEHARKGLAASGSLTVPLKVPKELQRRAEYVQARPFIAHIRYFRVPENERDLKFAQAWLRLTKQHFPAVTPPHPHREAAHSVLALKECPKFHIQVRRARIAADEIGARYEDYVYGINLRYLEDERLSKHFACPRLRDMGGPEHQCYAREYIEIDKSKWVLLTPDDIREAEADFLLAENYAESSADPDKKEIVETYLRDFLYPRMRAAAFANMGVMTVNVATEAIKQGLLPREWIENPETQADFPEFKDYDYDYYAPDRTLTAIFRPIS